MSAVSENRDRTTPLRPRRWTALLVRLFAVLLVAFLIVVALLPEVPAAREAARCAQCKINLRAIRLALQSYHVKFGSYPPAFIADESGRPMHSWRMLILPFLGQQALYDEYRFDEPWDGPHNSALHDRLQSHPFFCNSAIEVSHPNRANYVAVVGPGTAMPGGNSRTADELRNRASSTIMIVEALDCGTHWMEPKDLQFDEMCFGINDPSARGISSAHWEQKGAWSWTKPVPMAHVLLADGQVQDVPETTPPRIIQGLLLSKPEVAGWPQQSRRDLSMGVVFWILSIAIALVSMSILMFCSADFRRRLIFRPATRVGRVFAACFVVFLMLQAIVSFTVMAWRGEFPQIVGVPLPIVGAVAIGVYVCVRASYVWLEQPLESR